MRKEPSNQQLQVRVPGSSVNLSFLYNTDKQSIAVQLK